MAVNDLRTIQLLDGISSDRLRLGPEQVTILVSGTASDGHQLVIEVKTPPGGGPPLHVHRAEEVFYVLEGEFEFPTLVDGKQHVVSGKAGDSVFIPGGVPHTYHNVGQGIGRLFGVLAPATEIEAFFRHVGEPVIDESIVLTLDEPMDIPKVIEAGKRYNVEFLGP